MGVRRVCGRIIFKIDTRAGAAVLCRVCRMPALPACTA